MIDELTVLKLVASRLEAAAMPYMVTGSIALGYYAEPRMTRDIDLVVAVTAATARRLAQALSPEFLVSEETVAAAVARRGMFNAIHMAAVVKVRTLLGAVSNLDDTYLTRWAAHLGVSAQLTELRR